MKQAARVVILREGHDMLACGPTGEWGCNHLAAVLRERGLAVSLHSVEQGLAPRDRAADFCLVVAAWDRPRAQSTLARAGVEDWQARLDGSLPPQPDPAPRTP